MLGIAHRLGEGAAQVERELRVAVAGGVAGEAVRAGRAPSVAEAERTAKRLRRAARASTGSAMVEAAPMPPKVDDPEVVKQAAKDKLAEVKERRS